VICVVDGCVLLDHLRGVPEARDALERYDELRVSALTVTELERVHERVYGRGPGPRGHALDTLLAACTVRPVDRRIARTAASLAATIGLPLWDAVVLATARVDGLVLLTRHVGYDAPDAVIAYERNEPLFDRLHRSIAGG
jgi:predicted nucleic acid-binding protein